MKKDIRLTQEDLDRLTLLTRGIKRRRRPGETTERITENTLIRIAITHLLQNSASLQGSTEEELLASLNSH